MVHFGVSLDILSEKYYILFNTNFIDYKMVLKRIPGKGLATKLSTLSLIVAAGLIEIAE